MPNTTLQDQILTALQQRGHFKGPDTNGNYTALCPFHQDYEHPNLSVNLDRGFHCFACEERGGIKKLANKLGVSTESLTPKDKVVAAYDYQNENGNPIFQVVRYENKKFIQRRPDGKGGWIWNLKGVTRVLYRLPDILQALNNGETIYIVEGEKDALALVDAGLSATCNPNGAGKWQSSYSDTLKGGNTVIISDKDGPGRGHAADVAYKLYGKANSVKTIELPDKDGYGVKDTTDFLKAGGTKEEIEDIANEAEEYVPGESLAHHGPLDRHFSDTGNAEVLSDMYSDIIRYDYRYDRWLVWNGARWLPDADNQVERMALEAARARLKALVNEDLDDKTKQSIARWAINSENKGRIEGCKAMAKSLKPIADKGDDWDQNKMLLGMGNGVVDLRTSEFREGQPEDKITMATGVTYNPDAQCPRWLQFLDEIFEGPNMIDWIQRVLGYTLTGDISEEIVLICYGQGANGKSKFFNTIQTVMGSYAYNAPFSTFDNSSRASIPNDLASLDLKRFVYSSEINTNLRLNEQRLKMVSGGDSITARFLNKEFFTFYPVLKLWLFVNERPKVADDSYGFWRRVRLIPFTKQFRGKNEDKHLQEKLNSEAQGILNWMIRGCLEWQKRGIDDSPEAISTATHDYQVENDPIANFISDVCVEGSDKAVKSSDLYKAYRDWAVEEGKKEKEVLSSTAFGRIVGRRYQREHRRAGWFYSGITVSAFEDDEGMRAPDKSVDRETEGANNVIDSSQLSQDKSSLPSVSHEDDYPSRKSNNEIMEEYGLTKEKVLNLWLGKNCPTDIPVTEGRRIGDPRVLLDNSLCNEDDLRALCDWASPLRNAKLDG